jgi:glycosyltransferase involved in cell wall biosynthesis
MEYLFTAISLLWGAFLFYVYRGQKSLKSIDSVTGQADLPLNQISVILAVKDGASDLRESLPRLTELGVDVIVVNDRSRDDTQKVIDGYSVKSVTVTELPQDWLGKVHALHLGSPLATGEFILFMDPDINISKEVLNKAIKVCEDHKLDHLAILPETKHGEYLLNLMMLTSKFLFTWSGRTWLSIEKRPLHSVKGVGAFNLVRRSTFLRTEGFEWLRMDVADDVALAQLIAKNGGRSLLMKAGKSGPSLDWYKDFDDLVKGLEKNVVGGFSNYHVPTIIFMSVASIMVLVFHSLPLNILFTVIFAFAIKKYVRYTWFEIFSFPLGIALLGCILIRSSMICFRQGGIKWAGTFYPIEKLKKGSRVILKF